MANWPLSESQDHCASSFFCVQKSPLDLNTGLVAYPTLPGLPVLSRISPPGSQKGCRRPAWHTAGWVGAGSQLGPVGRYLRLSWHLVPLRELIGASSQLLWLQELQLGATLLSQSICPQPFTPHYQFQLLKGQGPPPKDAHWFGAVVTPTWRPFLRSNVTNRNTS